MWYVVMLIYCIFFSLLYMDTNLYTCGLGAIFSIVMPPASCHWSVFYKYCHAIYLIFTVDMSWCTELKIKFENQTWVFVWQLMSLFEVMKCKSEIQTLAWIVKTLRHFWSKKVQTFQSFIPGVTIHPYQNDVYITCTSSLEFLFDLLDQ